MEAIRFGDELLESGCYADGGFGWDHVREVLADYVEGFNPGIADELRLNMSDDAGEEYDALDILNEHTTGGYWELEDGLFLVADEEES